MKFSIRDRTAMLTAFGDTATIAGTVYPCLFSEAGRPMQHFDGSIMTSGPTVKLDETAAALVTESETFIVINGVYFVATQKLPTGSGFVDLELTRDY